MDQESRVDCRNRRLTPAERRAYWQAALELWRESELGVTAFCRREQLSSKSFRYWRKQLGPTAKGEVPSAECRNGSRPSGKCFERVHLIPAAAAAHESSRRSSSLGISGACSQAGHRMEIILSSRRRVVIHGDLFSSVLRCDTPHGDTVLAQVIRILEGLPAESDAAARFGHGAGVHDADLGEGHRC